ncbi:MULTISPECIES: class I SAM-dependent methyltransferase [unclassified Mycolicibacterium]|uniref:class I SAM-dependent methyltransferase n=1 Tax=unclassified Mycolicibacterium TaxID=2636767 RepID=UPI0012DC8CE7|nr:MULTISPECIES: class I SAM-dependent methyltransferase [unclassified Mycolicibacterium]MUL84930.1 class I SAM-dependent methyltransferase [Mycolicibacterium sp. CBMA 329]MUL90897.1 class I SAM-dependent methyltransferase [Mycolicibacterium sp. CBMA 331]MUL98432.1 class I SAM-dependent methyltransferase [Mycolicibacterium sp. CBMA 334]MUM27955.1 class I SAM-dependent methyltransferase [Mycolicibacterium sp. CBMA 295]MUM40656.1 class I SAM-dependent methyltransferase [Mycolicibacterium sp. CBM
MDSPDYGFDGDFNTVSARTQVAILGGAMTALLSTTIVSLTRGRRGIAWLTGGFAALLVSTVASFVHTTRRGKFAVWRDILDDLALRGDETLLDLGCGRGAVLHAAAKRLPGGRAIGIDLWRADQTGNSAQRTLANAALEGVADRIEIQTGDMTALPLDDNSVDVVVSSLAIHNIPDRAGRAQALAEAARVLRPGGQLAIADIWDTRRHAERLRTYGWQHVRRRNLGWRMWWGGPYLGTHLVSATKPATERETAGTG